MIFLWVSFQVDQDMPESDFISIYPAYGLLFFSNFKLCVIPQIWLIFRRYSFNVFMRFSIFLSFCGPSCYVRPLDAVADVLKALCFKIVFLYIFQIGYFC